MHGGPNAQDSYLAEGSKGKIDAKMDKTGSKMNPSPNDPPLSPKLSPPSRNPSNIPLSSSSSSTSVSSKSSKSSSSSTLSPPPHKWIVFFTSRFAWVAPNSSFAKWKPVIRCALVAWISLVLFVVPKVEVELGQAGFLILIVAFLSPPSDPFLMMLERELLIIFFVCLAWAWTSLGIFLADLTRNFHDPNASFLDAATGRYIEAAPCIIMAIFIFFGTAFFLFIRARKGPGPYLFPTVLGCICLDISLTTACIFPYPYYLSGRAVVLPLTLHTATSIFISLLVFPSTISALYTTRLAAVLGPLEQLAEKNKQLLAVGPYDDAPASPGTQSPGDENANPGSNASNGQGETEKMDRNSTAYPPTAPPKQLPPYADSLAAARALSRAAESALAPLAAAARLLHADLIYGRFAPQDFDALHGMSRRLVGRADGLGVYFGLVEAATSTVGAEAASPLDEETNVEGDGAKERDGRRSGVLASGITPGPLLVPNTKHIRIDTNRDHAHGSRTVSPKGTGARTPVHTHGRHTPKDAHISHSFSAPAVAGLKSSASSVRGGGGAGSGTTSPLHAIPSYLSGLSQSKSRDAHYQLHLTQTKSSHHSHLHSPLHHSQSLPQDGEGDHPQAHQQRAHAMHLHRSLLTLARTISHATIGHGREHDHDHENPHGHASGTATPTGSARRARRRAEWAVGTFESQRYMNLEATRLHDPRAEEWTRLTFGLLRESCTPFLGLVALGIGTTKSWLTNGVRSGRLKHFLGINRDEEKKKIKERRREIEEIRDKVKEGFRVFREMERHLVLDPYLRAFEHSVGPSAAVSPHASPPGSPLRHTSSLPQMGTAAGGSGDDGAETTPMIHGVMGDFAPAAAGSEVQHKHTPAIRIARVDDIALSEYGQQIETAEDEWVGVRTSASSPHHPEEDVLMMQSHGDDSSDTVANELFVKPNPPEDGVGIGEFKKGGGVGGGGGASGYHGRKQGTSAPQPPAQNSKDSSEMPPHRYLFHCYVYQYNLIQMGSIVIEMLDEILRLEAERPAPKLWTPVEHIFKWSPWSMPDDAEQMMSDDDNPDIIQGFHQKELENGGDSDTTLAGKNTRFRMPNAPWYDPEAEDLGLPRKRDPDSLPPRNAAEWFFNALSQLIIGLGGGNSVYAWKAGVLTVLLCLPSFFKSSAAFALENRFSWGIFMGQLSLARFRGDTTFSLVARVSATFFGGVTGMVMWYISAGSGNGNPYGLAAVCFVCFPVFFFFRLYCPIPPMMNIVFFVTSVLVIGYSYQDSHMVTPGAPGTGFSVFWKRVLLVTAGVFAAFIASFLPPSTTIRRYQRSLLATTSAEMGTIYCAILSFANTKHEREIQDIIISLIALRSKLSRSNALRTNVGYEFSLRGRWPSERYQKVADLQMALAYSLSHLMSVLEHLEPSWSRAFLRRTRFMDPDFQGDILAVISMISSSLRTGSPLPQITPCPLLDRFTHKYHGLDVIHKDSEEDYGLPRNLSIDTLRDEQYLMFCVGISIAYGLINRLDKLMLAAKEIVGEQYHIHGVGLRAYERR